MLQKGTVSAFLIHISEIRVNSKLSRQQTKWDLIYVTSILFQEPRDGCAI